MKKLLFIMNPFAGQKKANKVLPEILMLFTEAGYEINMSMTTGPGYATRLAAERGGRADLVVCCGGDGTLNETISGLLMAGIHVPVGYIPSGTTNDFASSLKLSQTPSRRQRTSSKASRFLTTSVNSVTGIFVMWLPLAPSPSPATRYPRL